MLTCIDAEPFCMSDDDDEVGLHARTLSAHDVYPSLSNIVYFIELLQTIYKFCVIAMKRLWCPKDTIKYETLNSIQNNPKHST